MSGLQSGDDLPPDIQTALHEAMILEHVPETWYDDLAWICAAESPGGAGVKSAGASGLFPLASSPAGKPSLGDAIDEARGGIRYIKDRYGDAANAKVFWLSHTHYSHAFY